MELHTLCAALSGGFVLQSIQGFLIDPDTRRDGKKEGMQQLCFPSLPGARGWDVPAAVRFIAVFLLILLLLLMLIFVEQFMVNTLSSLKCFTLGLWGCVCEVPVFHYKTGR